MEQCRLPKVIEDKLGLTLMDRVLGASLLHGCVFYKTKIENVIIHSYHEISNSETSNSLDSGYIKVYDYKTGKNAFVSLVFLE